MATVFNIKNEAFAGFVFYGALVMGKTIGMSLVTGAFRKIRGSLPTPEDAKVMAPNDKEKQKKLLQPDEKVERVRKMHLPLNILNCCRYFQPRKSQWNRVKDKTCFLLTRQANQHYLRLQQSKFLTVFWLTAPALILIVLALPRYVKSRFTVSVFEILLTEFCFCRLGKPI